MKKIGSLLLAGALGLNLAAMGMSHRVPIAAAADKSCVVENVRNGDDSIIDELVVTIQKLMR